MKLLNVVDIQPDLQKSLTDRAAFWNWTTLNGAERRGLDCIRRFWFSYTNYGTYSP